MKQKITLDDYIDHLKFSPGMTIQDLLDQQERGNGAHIVGVLELPAGQGARWYRARCDEQHLRQGHVRGWRAAKVRYPGVRSGHVFRFIPRAGHAGAGCVLRAKDV